jgi:hypothetical protein
MSRDMARPGSAVLRGLVFAVAVLSPGTEQAHAQSEPTALAMRRMTNAERAAALFRMALAQVGTPHLYGVAKHANSKLPTASCSVS